MHPLKEHASLALANLAEVMKFATEMDTAQDRKHALGKLCDDGAIKLDQANEAVKLARAEFAKVDGERRKQNAILLDQQNRSNASLDEQIAKGRDELADLQGRIVKHTKELSAIDASLDSLHKRLWLGN